MAARRRMMVYAARQFRKRNLLRFRGRPVQGLIMLSNSSGRPRRGQLLSLVSGGAFKYFEKIFRELEVTSITTGTGGGVVAREGSGEHHGETGGRSLRWGSVWMI